jgi:aldehyde dehydrogenase (NAD+)
MGATNGIEYPFIAGRRDTSRSTETFDSVNPATEEVIAQVVQCDQGHVDDAVAAAREAQRAWWKMSPATRGEHLWRWGDLLVEHSDELAKLDTIDMGKPIRDALAAAPATAKLCRYYAGLSDKIWGDMVPVTPGHLSYTMRDPLGSAGSSCRGTAPSRPSSAGSPRRSRAATPWWSSRRNSRRFRRSGWPS